MAAKMDHVLNSLVLLTMFVGILALGSLAGRIEGYLFPVARVTQLEVVGEVENDALIKGRFDKLRDCDFVRSEWYKGEAIFIDFERVDEVNEVPRGINHPWGVLRMDVSSDTIVEDGIRAVNVSRCSFLGIPLPWLTVTTAYDGDPTPLVTVPAVKGDRIK